MAFALPALAIGSAIASAGGALFQGAATANAANYQAQVAHNNAITAGQNAAYSTRAGEVEAEQKSRQGAEKVAAVKAAMAANNVDVNTGSAVDVETGGRENAVTDTQNTFQNAILKAYGYRTQETGFQAQAGLDTQEAETAPIGAGLTAAGDLLSGAKGFVGGSGGSDIGNLFNTGVGLPATYTP